ncbi:MAG TPA: serine/threonine-protein kinase [Enhygromyxa sp.]|nr:serine/threonine-protein kinase [Enhygromyxa sp.]
MNRASGQPSESDATLISGDSVVGEVAGMGRLAPGKTFAGRHLLLARLGASGAGIIYAAYDSKLDRKVALELLRPRLNDAVVDAAKRIAEVSHPNILTVFEVGTVHDIVFVIMDLVDGGSLREWIDGGPHRWPVVLGLFRRLAAGLAAAHHAGLIHGAFAPEHVQLTRELDPRIADFGIADTVSADSMPAPRTPTDRRRAAWAYLAPERLADRPADARADQFGFCVAFYEALYGEAPFEGRTLQAISLAITEGRIREPPTGSKVPTWLRRIIARGLASDPELRWPSMDALIDAIDRESSKHRQRPIAGVALGVAVIAGALAIAHEAPTTSPSALSDDLARHEPIDEFEAVLDQLRALQLALRRAQFCAVHGQWVRQNSLSTCDRTPADYVEQARELAAQLDRLQHELDP